MLAASDARCMQVAMSLSPNLRRIVDHLAGQPALDVATLRRELSAWFGAVNAAAIRQSFFDFQLAERLHDAAGALLDDVARGAFDDAQRALVQAGVRYLAAADDVDHDLESMLGLEDDAEVLAHVARAVGRPELVVEP